MLPSRRHVLVLQGGPASSINQVPLGLGLWSWTSSTKAGQFTFSLRDTNPRTPFHIISYPGRIDPRLANMGNDALKANPMQNTVTTNNHVSPLEEHPHFMLGKTLPCLNTGIACTLGL